MLQKTWASINNVARIELILLYDWWFYAVVKLFVSGRAFCKDICHLIRFSTVKGLLPCSPTPCCSPCPIAALPERTLCVTPSLEEEDVWVVQWPGWPRIPELGQKWRSKTLTSGYLSQPFPSKELSIWRTFSRTLLMGQWTWRLN